VKKPEVRKKSNDKPEIEKKSITRSKSARSLNKSKDTTRYREDVLKMNKEVRDLKEMGSKWIERQNKRKGGLNSIEDFKEEGCVRIQSNIKEFNYI